MKPLAPIHWPYLGVHVHSISPEQKRGKRWKQLAEFAQRAAVAVFLTMCGLTLLTHCVRLVAS